MFLKRILIVQVCLMTGMVFLLWGCGERKSRLDLPEKEMSELKSTGKNPYEAEKAFSEKKNKSAKARFYVYAEKGYFKNHFIPSGWMGDYGDMRISDGCRENPFSRRSCIKVIYTGRRSQGAGWAGIYWQDPANNWGNLSGGYDLTGAEKLSFYAKGEKGGEIITEFKMGGIEGEFSDSTSTSIGPVVLTPEWKKYTIGLKDEDLSHIIGGFSFIVSQMENPEGATFYLDEIVYE